MTARHAPRPAVWLPLAAGLLLGGCGKDADLPAPLPANFHELDPGRVYRSAQPGPVSLTHAIDTYGIKTVLNLRGDNTGTPWYDQEAAVCAEKGITLANFAMSSRRLPDPDLLRGIIEVLEHGEYPILMHCSGGADRTGAISALYRMLILEQPRDAALGELDVKYWHFRAKAPCMDVFAEMYEPSEGWIEHYTTNYHDLECGSAGTTTDPAEE